VTTQKQEWVIKSWHGLLIKEKFILNEDGTETDLLENCEPWRKKELKVLRV
jgi:hypothetical protein